MEPEEPQQQQPPKSEKVGRAVKIEYWTSNKSDKNPENRKTFRIPKHELKDCEKYFEVKYPKQQSKYKQRKFYTPEELKEMESKLTCNIHLRPQGNEKLVIPQRQTHTPAAKLEPQPPALPKVEEKLVRPPLNKEGPTHFVNISLAKELAQTYKGLLETTIKEPLLPLDSLNVTLVRFTLKKQEELVAWESLLKTCKKFKLSIKGIGMVGVKNLYASSLYLNVSGVDDIVDTIMGKAVERELVLETDNADHIRFEKTTQLYKMQQPQVKILQTVGKDLIEAGGYLKSLKDVSLVNVPIAEIRISVMDSYVPGKGFYNETIIKL